MVDFAEKSARVSAARALGSPISYEIAISEPQRAALRAVLASAAPLPEALEYWVEMLDALPADEAAAPGILHGFCL